MTCVFPFQRLNDLFSEFDTDGTGSIDLKEYLSFMKILRLEAEARARDLKDIPIVALKGENGKRYLPPKTGRYFDLKHRLHCVNN